MDRQIITREIFYFLSAALGMAILMEMAWPRIILAYFNLNWLLVLWLVSGLAVLFRRKS